MGGLPGWLAGIDDDQCNGMVGEAVAPKQMFNTHYCNHDPGPAEVRWRSVLARGAARSIENIASRGSSNFLMSPRSPHPAAADRLPSLLTVSDLRSACRCVGT